MFSDECDPPWLSADESEVQIVAERSYQRDFIADSELLGRLPVLTTIGAHQAVVRRAEGSGTRRIEDKAGNMNFHQHPLKRMRRGIDGGAGLVGGGDNRAVPFPLKGLFFLVGFLMGILDPA